MFADQGLVKHTRKLRILKIFYFKLPLFLEKIRHFLINTASYSFKPLLLYVKDSTLCQRDMLVFACLPRRVFTGNTQNKELK